MTFFIGNYNVKYVGAVSLLNLVKLIRDWFVDYEWVKSSEGQDFPEIYYSHANSQPGGQELWIWWRFHWRAPTRHRAPLR